MPLSLTEARDRRAGDVNSNARCGGEVQLNLDRSLYPAGCRATSVLILLTAIFSMRTTAALRPLSGHSELRLNLPQAAFAMRSLASITEYPLATRAWNSSRIRI